MVDRAILFYGRGLRHPRGSVAGVGVIERIDKRTEKGRESGRDVSPQNRTNTNRQHELDVAMGYRYIGTNSRCF